MARGVELMIWTEFQTTKPVHTAWVRSGSARGALKRFGFKAAQINRVIDDLDCGRAVRIQHGSTRYDILLNGKIR